VAAKLEGRDFSSPTYYQGKTAFEFAEGSKTTTLVLESVGGKKKRGTFSEEDILTMTNMTDVANNVVNAMINIGVAHVDPVLYLAIMEMTEFTTEALIVSCTHLIENKAVATGFVNMSNPRRVIWLRIYLGTNYCM
jgi:hypothetical protein